jgi:phospholipase/carboxylesterase
MSNYLPAIEIETAPNPAFAVIWMHGLGANGQDFVPVLPHLHLPPELAVRFIFPHAPAIPVTWNNGYVMPAWYDIVSVDRNARHVDEAGLRHSRTAIRALIERENQRGVPTEHIVLAGFSQGGAMAYTVALTHPERLAGVLALSTYLPSPALVEAEFSAANRNTPVFAAHGTEDEVLPLALGEHARDTVRRLGCTVAWHTYDMPHSVNMEEIADIGAWLAATLQAL